jgi:hypothetical protein
MCGVKSDIEVYGNARTFDFRNIRVIEVLFLYYELFLRK